MFSGNISLARQPCFELENIHVVVNNIVFIVEIDILI